MGQHRREVSVLALISLDVEHTMRQKTSTKNLGLGMRRKSAPLEIASIVGYEVDRGRRRRRKV
jgi:hypothetical protein